jgi:hypothetical protein
MPLNVQAYAKRDNGIVYAFVLCPTCRLPSALALSQGKSPTATADWFLTADAKGSIDILVKTGWEVATTFPEFREKEAPQHTPDDIARLYKQAASAQSRQENDAAGFLYGKTLEVAIKRLAPSTTGTLAQRIDRLSQDGIISEDVRKWAHEIRLVRNDAVHEINEPVTDEITAMAEFTEAFLMFVFTMRKKYEDRKSKQANKAS